MDIISIKATDSIYYKTSFDFHNFQINASFDYLGKLYSISFEKDKIQKLKNITPPINIVTSINRVIFQLKDYFFNKREVFNIQTSPSLTDFQYDVLNFLKDNVKYGHIVSYKELAVSLGKPTSSRAIANVMSKNPLPIYYPCHRVVKSNSDIGEYAFKSLGVQGRVLKKLLLEIESEKK